MGIIRLSARENKTLIESQLTTLTRARMPDLESGDYRSFIEGVGREFQDIDVSIKGDGPPFQYGPKLSHPVCSQNTFPIGKTGTRVQMCRESHAPILPFILLFGAYLITASLSLKAVRWLERNTLSSLIQLVRDSGVEVDARNGLPGVLSRIETIQSDLKKAQARAIALAKAEAMAQFSAQLAHDIRSPLAALDVMTEDFSEIPEDIRSLLSHVTTRIQDIAQKLLEKSHEYSLTQQGLKAPLLVAPHPLPQSNEPVHLASVLEAIIAEKRLQFKNDRDLLIDLSIDLSGLSLFTHLDAPEFKRAISNLINNAQEALRASGKIVVTLSRHDRKDGFAEIRIRDNGPGIPPEILSRLGSRGETFGKVGGSGLGIHHAKETITSLGGEFSIHSDRDPIHPGTQVTLLLPEIQPPAWFVPSRPPAMQNRRA